MLESSDIPSGASVAMAGLGDIVQKAFYLGVGLASYAGEKAGSTLAQLRTQAQKLADEMVARGEMTAEEGRKFVDDMIARAQQPQAEPEKGETRTEPRRIEILDDEDPSKSEGQPVDSLRQQVEALQEELRRLQRD
ncbi:phasin family protein [Kamptonema formosum]|uniref:phasin family protein n=1 Tax=Kamptonema formosum TaxID=331992 RepID=UPI00037F3690